MALADVTESYVNTITNSKYALRTADAAEFAALKDIYSIYLNTNTKFMPDKKFTHGLSLLLAHHYSLDSGVAQVSDLEYSKVPSTDVNVSPDGTTEHTNSLSDSPAGFPVQFAFRFKASVSGPLLSITSNSFSVDNVSNTETYQFSVYDSLVGDIVPDQQLALADATIASTSMGSFSVGVFTYAVQTLTFTNGPELVANRFYWLKVQRLTQFLTTSRLRMADSSTDPDGYTQGSLDGGVTWGVLGEPFEHLQLTVSIRDEGAFVTDNSIAVTVNGIAIAGSPIAFDGDSATTLANIATALQAEPIIATAVSDGMDTIVITGTVPGTTITVASVVTGGVVQATPTITVTTAASLGGSSLSVGAITSESVGDVSISYGTATSTTAVDGWKSWLLQTTWGTQFVYMMKTFRPSPIATGKHTGAV